MADETYNGWTNRETWATYLWLTNEERLYKAAIQIVHRRLNAPSVMLGSDELVRDNLRGFIEELFTWENMTERMAGEGLYRMREDIGSLWRVDWREIVQHLKEDSVQWDNDKDNDYEGDETPLAMAMEGEE